MGWLFMVCIFCLGFMTGIALNKAAFKSQDWVILRWCADSFGYRPIATGGRIHRGDRVMMSLKLDTMAIPDEGIVVEEQ